METNKDFDMSSLSLQELIEVYETINTFLDFLEESKIKDGETSNG